MISETLALCSRELDALADLSREIPESSSVQNLLTRPFVMLHAVSDLYTARTALGLALDLGWEPMLRRGATLDELLDGCCPPSRIPAAWILRFLAEKNLLIQEGPRYRLEGTPCLDLAELREIAEQEAPGHRNNLDLLDAVRSHVKPYFTQGKNGEACLFDLAVFPMWLDYFRNENILYRSNNLFALELLRASLKPGCRILELGGGAGSFAQLLSSTTSPTEREMIGEYRFTDVAPTFVRRAQRGLKESAPGLPFTFGALDINRPLDDQGLAGTTFDAFDAIVGINVLHVARNLPATLADLKRHLAPSGQLIMGECLKPDLERPIYLEFFFEFMSSFTEVETDPDLRPTHGFLTPEAWKKILTAAGFREVRDVPDVRQLMNRFPAFNVGALAGTH